MAGEIDGISQIDTAELLEILKNNKDKYKIIDVREPEEYTAGHIPGIPLCPMNTIPGKMEEMDKDAEYIFVCRSGSRSHQVSRYLKHHGFEKVHNFYGGMLSWTGEKKTGMEE